MTENKYTDTNSYDFEAAIKRLDEIAVQLSSNELELDKALAVYEEGVALIRSCNARLEDAKRRISVIRMSAEGEIEEQPLDASDAAEA